MAIRDLRDAPGGMHRAVGSQLIYNRKSGQSLFLGALSSERLLTIFHLQVKGSRIESYTVDSTGTTEILAGESLSVISFSPSEIDTTGEFRIKFSACLFVVSGVVLAGEWDNDE